MPMLVGMYNNCRRWSIIKNDDGSLTVTQREYEDNGMYGFILSFGEYAEVLEPEHIRNIIKEKAMAVSKKYSE